MQTELQYSQVIANTLWSIAITISIGSDVGGSPLQKELSACHIGLLDFLNLTRILVSASFSVLLILNIILVV